MKLFRKLIKMLAVPTLPFAFECGHFGFIARNPVFAPAEDVALRVLTVTALSADTEIHPMLPPDGYPDAFVRTRR